MYGWAQPQGLRYNIAKDLRGWLCGGEADGMSAEV